MLADRSGDVSKGSSADQKVPSLMALPRVSCPPNFCRGSTCVLPPPPLLRLSHQPAPGCLTISRPRRRWPARLANTRRSRSWRAQQSDPAVDGDLSQLNPLGNRAAEVPQIRAFWQRLAALQAEQERQRREEEARKR